MAHKINKYIECKIEITPRQGFYKYQHPNLTPEGLIEAEIRWYKGWIKEFEEFLRDHRHQDANNLDIDVIKKDVCSQCGDNWETYFEDHVEMCANCGATIEKIEVIK